VRLERGSRSQHRAHRVAPALAGWVVDQPPGCCDSVGARHADLFCLAEDVDLVAEIAKELFLRPILQSSPSR